MKKIFLLALTLVFVLSACANVATPFDRNLAIWKEANVSNYRYQLSVVCFCPYMEDMPLTIEVQNGKMVSMTRPDGTQVDSSSPSYETYVSYATIDGLFLKLQSVLGGEAEEVTVSYDSVYGFPATIMIDYIKLAIDDELSLQVSKFEILE